jgi:hypothetical protein
MPNHYISPGSFGFTVRLPPPLYRLKTMVSEPNKSLLRQTAVAIMPHDGTMCRSSETPLERVMSGLSELPGWLAEQPTSHLGEVIT